MSHDPPPPRGARDPLPPWLRARRLNPGEGRATRRVLRQEGLDTVCEAARCPNQGHCFERGTATFMILGDQCTRACRFCNVADLEGPREGRRAPDPGEPARVVRAAIALDLRHVVVTSVTRDDLPDGGAAHFAAVIRALVEAVPGCTVEVLVPDFKGASPSIEAVLAARPHVFNHNVETVARLYPEVRPQASLERSLAVLRQAATAATALVKSGFMVGLGETDEEVHALLRQLAGNGVQLATIGQYLQPNRRALPVARYVEPAAFERFRVAGLAAGLREVFAGPLVRSSYLAEGVLGAIEHGAPLPE